MAKKKVSKKKGIDNNNLILGVVVILLLIGVFWYFNNQGVYFSPGMENMDGDGMGDIDRSEIEDMGGEEDGITEEEKQRLEEWLEEFEEGMPEEIENGGCCYISCKFYPEEGIQVEAENRLDCKNKIKEICLKKNDKERGPGKSIYNEGYECSNIEINSNTISASVGPGINGALPANENYRKAPYRPWSVPDGYFPGDDLEEDENGNLCTLENAKKIPEGRAALEFMEEKCLKKVKEKFRCRSGVIEIKNVVYSNPDVRYNKFLNELNFPWLAPLCSVFWNCAYNLECRVA